MIESEKKSFAEWALVELMGHSRIVGYVTEETIAGAAMLKVAVPDKDGKTLYHRFYGSSAIYAINPISREMAIRLAANCDSEPVKAYQLPALPSPEEAADTF